MSRIHDALKRLEAERAGKNGKSNGHGNGNGAGSNGSNGANGNGRNGHGNGHGNGANGKGRRGWQWLFPGVMRAKRNGGHDGGELRRRARSRGGLPAPRHERPGVSRPAAH